MRFPVKYILPALAGFFFVSLLSAQTSVQKKKKEKHKKNQTEISSDMQEVLDEIAGNMVWVTGGKFIMGNFSGEADEKPEFEVTIDGFAISKFPVTQQQWITIMGSYPGEFEGCDNCPVEMVSWNDAWRFIQILNEHTGKAYTLPTEAEWEYAAKGGLRTKHFKYSGSNNIDQTGWYVLNSGRHPHPVGEKLPNELGLYDMTGNVWEWCQDWYSKNYYDLQRHNNPTGPKDGVARVRRGGSWFTQAGNCATSSRNSVKQDYKDDAGGFRLAQYPN